MNAADDIVTIPTGDDLRNELVRRAKRYAEAAAIPITEVGKRAVNDAAFVADLEAGRNITMKLYDKFREFLEVNEPKVGIASQKRRRS